MDWLMQNPLADMRGPAFLFFYAGVILTVAAVCLLARRALDWTGRMPPPAIPHDPDPHEIAYLRGGENEVARSSIFSLVQRGLLSFQRDGNDYVVAPATERAERRALSPIELRTLDCFAAPQKVSTVFRAGGLASQLKPFCASYDQKLRQEHFLPTHAMISKAQLLRWAAAMIVLSLGSYKLLIALSRGRTNVLFLIVLGVVGLLIVLRAGRLPRLTERGRDYLERLRVAFERLRDRAALASHPSSPAPSIAPGAVAGDGAVMAAYDPTLPLLVGVFGVTALAGTQFDYFQQSFQRSAMGGSSSGGGACGSSCGSSDSSSSDGGGSCSSGSSCGSSCGGGCGGCGD